MRHNPGSPVDLAPKSWAMRCELCPIFPAGMPEDEAKAVFVCLCVIQRVPGTYAVVRAFVLNGSKPPPSPLLY